MITFKQFLIDAALSKKPKYVRLDVDTAIDTLNKYAKNALWMLDKNTPLYRGDLNPPKSSFSIVDTAASERKSQNTSNHYTVIFDNHPQRQKYPKRSRSFICTTDKKYASNYSEWRVDPFVVIPFDDVPIGAVNSSDMWGTRIELGKLNYPIDMMNDIFKNLGIEPSIESFERFSKSIKDGSASPEILKYFESRVMNSKDDKNDFMNAIWKAYSEKATGHSLHTTSTLKGVKGEVWVGGKVILIKYSMWLNLLKAWEQLKDAK